MTEEDLFGILKSCIASQLDELTVRLDLDTRSLPGRNEAPSTRAVEIFALIKQRADGLTQLESLLVDMFRLSRQSPAARLQVPSKPQTILILASNPLGTSDLALSEEVAAVRSALIEGPDQTLYRVEVVVAANPQEVSRYLLSFEPTIVHFSGHGSEDGQIILQDETVHLSSVNPKALPKL